MGARKGMGAGSGVRRWSERRRGGRGSNEERGGELAEQRGTGAEQSDAVPEERSRET